jgi:hypothetical protein
MKRVTVNLPDDLVAFLERKKADIRRQVPKGKEDKVSTSAVLEGILAFWRTLDLYNPEEEPKDADSE